MSATMYTPGDIVLVHGTGLADRIIQRGTNSYWNHVAGIVSPAGDLVEALSQGVTKTTIAKYRTTAEPVDARAEGRIVPTGLPESERALFVSFLMERVGEPYGWPTIGGIVVARLTGLKLIFGVRGRPDCSWLTGEALAHAGVDLGDDETMLTPGDLAAHFAVTPR